MRKAEPRNEFKFAGTAKLFVAVRGVFVSELLNNESVYRKCIAYICRIVRDAYCAVRICPNIQRIKGDKVVSAVRC